MIAGTKIEISLFFNLWVGHLARHSAIAKAFNSISMLLNTPTCLVALAATPNNSASIHKAGPRRVVT